MVKLGKFTIESVSDGFFRLDGGSMFGIVPKVIWEKSNPPDEKNRILLGLNPLLIKTGRENILIDTGIGDKGGEKFKSIYAVDNKPNLTESLAFFGLTTDDIDIVINTHLHFDHSGGNTKVDKNGNIVPVFSKAKYYVQKGEWEEAINPNERTKGSYHKEDFVPIMESGQLVLLNGECEIVEGVSVIKTSGHIKHIQLVKIESCGSTAIFLSDIIPTVTHLSPPYIMGYDIFPLETLKAKKDIIKNSVDNNWLLIFEHDPEVKMGYVELKDGKPVLKKGI